jgi:predicted Zn-dependent peptidase
MQGEAIMTTTLIKSPVIKPLNLPTIIHLPDGLTVIAEQIPVDAVNLSLWLNVGSAQESDEINGMAHFLEHMIFKGTPRLAPGEFERLIEQRGAVTNAATSQEYTHYYIASAPQDFAQLAPLLLEIVLNPSLPVDAFDKEKLVVLEEIRRSEDNPGQRSYRHSMEMAFAHMPYRRPVLGPADVVSQLTVQQMRQFHQQWYQPQTMTAVAVGNLPVEELIAIVSDAYTQAMSHRVNTDNTDNIGNTPPLMPTVHPTFTCETPFTEIVRSDFVDETLQQARLMMIWRVPGLQKLEETVTLDVLATILGQGRTSRLFQDLRETSSLVNGISASNLSYGQQGIFYISARCPVENLSAVEGAIAQHIRDLQQLGVKETEVTRLRRLVANRFIFANETPSDRANLYGYYQSMLGDLAPALTYPTRIQAVDQSDVQASAQKYLSAEAYGIVTIRPKTT